MADGAYLYLENVRRQCGEIHSAIQQIYFDYLVESELVA
jgi:hypothetical protein